MVRGKVWTQEEKVRLLELIERRMNDDRWRPWTDPEFGADHHQQDWG